MSLSNSNVSYITSANNLGRGTSHGGMARDALRTMLHHVHQPAALSDPWT